MKRILMVVANPAVSTTTGWPVGFWASELIHPYDTFAKRGYAVTIASPNGGEVEFDSLSDPRDESGYSKDDSLSLDYIGRPEFMALLQDTPSVSALRADDFDAIVVAGGQSPMFTFPEATELQQLFRNFYELGKPSAALCHGVCLLLHVTDGEGRPVIAGKTITGFTNAEEDYADNAVGQKVMPFRIEDEALRLGANFVTKPAFEPHAVRDGRLVTGQQQNSGAETARLVIEIVEGSA